MMRGLLNRFLALLGKHELGVLLAFAGIFCGVWLFAAIAGVVMEGDTQAIDQRLLLAMRDPGDHSPLGPPSVQDAARDVTALGGVTVLTLVTLATGGFLLLDGNKHMALFVYGSVAGGTLLSDLLKELFQRPRPELVPHAAYVSTTSFPSGHSMMSAVTYLTLGALLARSHQRKRLKAYFLLLAGLLTLMVGVSHVYLGVHWPTDVLAGWTAGASWAIFCWLVARWLQGRHAIEAENERGLIEDN
jgi:undecaprenyl-diphosphatase